MTTTAVMLIKSGQTPAIRCRHIAHLCDSSAHNNLQVNLLVPAWWMHLPSAQKPRVRYDPFGELPGHFWHVHKAQIAKCVSKETTSIARSTERYMTKDAFGYARFREPLQETAPSCGILCKLSHSELHVELNSNCFTCNAFSVKLQMS